MGFLIFQPTIFCFSFDSVRLKEIVQALSRKDWHLLSFLKHQPSKFADDCFIREFHSRTEYKTKLSLIQLLRILGLPGEG